MKYEKLEEENKSLRMVLKTYEDINQLDKDEDSFDIQEDKIAEKKNFQNDYYGYDQGGLEAVQEENSQYESNDSRSNIIINNNKKKLKRVINQCYDYVQEKQLDLFKEKSTSRKKQLFSTQKSQKSIFDHENILNQLDFEHKRYSKRSISLPRLASRKIKKSVKKLTTQSRLFKLNVRIEKILSFIQKIKKKETKLQININRLINTVKLNQGNNQQFADYISEQPYFIDDNAFQNNLEVQMEYTNDNSIRHQHRKSTTKNNTRDSLRANKQRFSTQPSGTIFQLEENNKDLQKSNLELKELLINEQQKNEEVLSNLNQILQNYLDYDDTLPTDIIDSLSIMVNRIDQLKIYITQQQEQNPSLQYQNKNILMVLQEQISTCENQQAASMNNLNYLYSQVQDENLSQIVENQLNINNALLTSIKKINDNYYKLINTQKENEVQPKDVQIETLYQGEDQDISEKNSYDSDEMNQFETNLNTNTNNYDVIDNQSQPSLLENQEELEKEKPIREDHEIYQRNLNQKKTNSQVGTSRISSDYEMQNLDRNQLIQNFEENINSNLNILQVLQQDQNVEILLDLTQKTLQELQFSQEFSQTKIPVQKQYNDNEQVNSKKLIQLENEVYQKELNIN